MRLGAFSCCFLLFFFHCARSYGAAASTVSCFCLLFLLLPVPLSQRTCLPCLYPLFATREITSIIRARVRPTSRDFYLLREYSRRQSANLASHVFDRAVAFLYVLLSSHMFLYRASLCSLLIADVIIIFGLVDLSN